MTQPKPNQIWGENDPRSAQRQLRVIETNDQYAFVITIVDIEGRPVPLEKRRRTRIKLTRFTPGRSGYRLLQDAPE